MAKFFKPEDFSPGYGTWMGTREDAAAFANEKLEKEGRIIYCGDMFYEWSKIRQKGHNIKAVMVNIEPIEECNHPYKDVTSYPNEKYMCMRCGVKVKPSNFVEE